MAENGRNLTVILPKFLKFSPAAQKWRNLASWSCKILKIFACGAEKEESLKTLCEIEGLRRWKRR